MLVPGLMAQGVASADIVEFPEGNGAVSVVVNVNAQLACSFLSSYEYGAVSYLVDLDVEGASTTDGADVHQWTCTPPGAANQQWRLIPIA